MKPTLFETIVLSCFLSLFSTTSLAQRNLDTLRFQYAVKCICGVAEPPTMAAGKYFTATNIHNPTDQTVVFWHKVAIAAPAKGGPISKFMADTLRGDQAMELDCREVQTQLRQSKILTGAFLKGFLVIESPIQLDVEGVYSAAGKTGMIETLELERVSARRMERVPGALPDLTLSSACWFGDSVTVCIVNQGKADAPASTTTLKFSNGTIVKLPTPPIVAGKTVCLPHVAAPGSCFRPDCYVTVTVDSDNVIPESDESNNTSIEICIG